MDTIEPLIIFHYACADGLGALWAARSALPNSKVWGGSYGQAPPPLESYEGRDVVVVDFSYPRAVLEEMATAARSVLVLDHHDTARIDLEGLPRPPGSAADWITYWQDKPINHISRDYSCLSAVFDMNRSGAGITWDYFHPGKERPRIIDLIEDRDLWRFKYSPDTRAFDANLRLWDMTKWETMVSYLGVLDRWSKDSDKGMWATELAQGAAIVKFQAQAVDAILAVATRWMTIFGQRVPVANCPGQFASEAGNSLVTAYTAAPFAATYYDGNDGYRHFSLRSGPEGLHVGKLAKLMGERPGWNGGGGHPRAAGANAPLGWEGEDEQQEVQDGGAGEGEVSQTRQ